MHLVQFLVPVAADATARDAASFGTIRRELTERFGGVTAYERNPATGVWQRDDGGVEVDRVVMVEVEVRELDRAWWRAYKRKLEELFHQDAILIRALPADEI
jgi:hypothetical protein